MNNLTDQEVSVYHKKRKNMNLSKTIDTRSPCSAPFNNMYFTSDGKVSPCWLLVGAVETWDGTKTIKDIWAGDAFEKYRNNLINNIFEQNCKVCKNNILADNWPLAMAYDHFSIKEYPTLLELELSNQCNLECVMCEGRLSSGIRKNRDKLPPMPMLYDDNFVEQLKDFIPHLEELRFNGGEPFAQKIVYDICMLVADINPKLKINIATNGTVYNKQVQKILNRCNIHLNISIDSLDKNNYESIRINGDFDDLMKNFQIFKKYCHDNDRMLSVMINPMRNNWWEMPDFVNFCNTNRVYLWYNTIHHPNHLALWNLPKDELKTIYESLSDKLAQLDIKDTFGNLKKCQHLVHNQIKNWYNKQLDGEEDFKKTIIKIEQL
jgi:radical SAM protein with 4Fe4S-binding SPASM domain